MFDLNTIQLINKVAQELRKRNYPEKDAVKVVTDPRRSKEYQTILETVIGKA